MPLLLPTLLDTASSELGPLSFRSRFDSVVVFSLSVVALFMLATGAGHTFFRSVLRLVPADLKSVQ